MKFYKCARCGKIIAVVKDTPVPVVCCGEAMKELIPGTSDGAAEKHVPVYEVKDNMVCVSVGSAAHPMIEAHYIEWIAVKTNSGCQMKYLKPGAAPKACFALTEGEALEAVYAYCNLHSLWKA